MADGSTATLVRSEAAPAERSSRQAKGASVVKVKVAYLTFDALPDTVDFRDKMYVLTLVEVPQVADMTRYRSLQIDNDRETPVSPLQRITGADKGALHVSPRLAPTAAKAVRVRQSVDTALGTQR